MKLNLGCGPNQLNGFVNVTKSDAWQLEDGLHDYTDGSVEAITISHALMYVPLSEWPPMFEEFARVLAPGGILRVTEDDTADPASPRYGGWHDAATLTSPGLVRSHMHEAGMKVRKHSATSSGFKDKSLLQAWHGEEPKVFFIEGKKPE